METSHMQITTRPMRKPKRFRSAFTTEQIKFLELQFKKFPYISSEHRTEISTALNMQERAVKIWFQNRRMKEKKESTNKELDYATVTKTEETGKDRLNNVCTVPSTNDQLSYSIPVVKPVDSMSIFTGANTDSFHKEVREKFETQQVPQNLSTTHIKSLINFTEDLNVHHASLPNALPSVQKGEPSRKQFKNRNQPFHRKPMEFSLDLSKRLKKGRREINQDQKPKLQKKLGMHSSITVKPRTIEEAAGLKKKTTSPPALSKLSKQAKSNGPTYFPVMPTVYAHPYISSGGVIWKPFNIMPVVTPGNAVPAPSHPQQSFGHAQKMNCNCNCHGNAQSLTVSPNMTSPYAQYVFTTSAPYPNSSPKF